VASAGRVLRPVPRSEPLFKPSHRSAPKGERHTQGGILGTGFTRRLTQASQRSRVPRGESCPWVTSGWEHQGGFCPWVCSLGWVTGSVRFPPPVPSGDREYPPRGMSPWEGTRYASGQTPVSVDNGKSVCVTSQTARRQATEGQGLNSVGSHFVASPPGGGIGPFTLGSCLPFWRRRRRRKARVVPVVPVFPVPLRNALKS
jgi:hypothetical protein